MNTVGEKTNKEVLTIGQRVGELISLTPCPAHFNLSLPGSPTILAEYS